METKIPDPVIDLEAAENWLLSALDQGDALPYEACRDMVVRLASARGAQADSWAELLHEALVRLERQDACVDLLETQLSWHTGDVRFTDLARRRIGDILRDSNGLAIMESAGWDGSIPVEECLRRTRLLCLIGAGTLCFDKTWGFGVVDRCDAFYRKIIIDFRLKPQHALSFAYAAETLRILDDNHLLARCHRDPDGMRRQAVETPDSLVRLVLEGFGPLTVDQVRERLVGLVIEDAGWAAFWDGARKRLKADPFIHIPARRSEPIRILEEARGFHGAWMERFRSERDMEQILGQVELLVRQEPERLKDPAYREVLFDRLSFVIRGAPAGKPALTGRAVLLGEPLGCKPEVSPDSVRCEPAAWVGAIEHLYKPDTLLDLTGSATVFARVIAFLGRLCPARLVPALSDIVERLPFTAVDAAADFMAADGNGVWQTMIRDAMLARLVPPVVLLWLCRHVDWMEQEQVGTRRELVLHIFQTLDVSMTDEPARAQAQIRKFLDQSDWLTGVIEPLPEKDQQDVLRRLDGVLSLDAGDRRSMMARIIKRYPHTAVVLTAGDEPETPAGTLHFTSWRSYRERMAQLKDLVEVQIPQNSKDIAHARSYGDLRENFEYQSAREQQRLFMQRQGELESDLKSVRGSDFKGMPSEVAGPGTTVMIERTGGIRDAYVILGEWDRDEALGIISSKSRMAEVLAGKRAGDRVVLPGADAGDEPARIVAVEPLTDAVRAWIGSAG